MGAGRAIGAVLFLALGVMFLADGAMAYSGTSFLWPDEPAAYQGLFTSQADYSYADFGIGALFVILGIVCLA